MVVLRNIRRLNTFRKAEQMAAKLKKPLVVIGNPASGGWFARWNPFKYGCGDLCVDIQGCDDMCDQYVTADVVDILPKLKSNSCVIFISVVLEYIDNIEFVISELYRIAGKNLFVVFIKNQPYGASYTDKGTFMKQKHQILAAPPEQNTIIYRTL